VTNGKASVSNAHLTFVDIFYNVYMHFKCYKSIRSAVVLLILLNHQITHCINVQYLSASVIVVACYSIIVIARRLIIGKCCHIGYSCCKPTSQNAN